MVEGPLVHRVAEIHRVLLLGKAFRAISPSGRFTEGAAAINGRYVSLIEAHGKNIFHFFTTQKLEKAELTKLPDDVVVVHIHFGMSGSFRLFVFPGPEPREKTRLRLQNEDEKIDVHLTSSICVHGGMELYRHCQLEEKSHGTPIEIIARLGPDPLRVDADIETMWRKMQVTRKTIGSILMDQTLVAGIGNIYRSEILFVSGVHPDQRASTLSRSTFEKMWGHSTRLFMLGMVTGSLVTVSPTDVGKPLHQEVRSEWKWYVYSQSVCKLCGGAIRKWPSAGRTVYACEVCQPLRENKEKIEDKTLVKDALIGPRKAAAGHGGLISLKENVEADEPDSPGMSKSSLGPKKAMKSVSSFGKRKGASIKIMEHQPFKDISTVGLRDFSSRLTYLTRSRHYLSAVGKDSLWHSASERDGFSRKYHSEVSLCGPLVHENSWGLWQALSTQCFPTRRVGYIAFQVLGSAKPQPRIGLQAVRTLCLGSSSPLLMLSARLSKPFTWQGVVRGAYATDPTTLPFCTWPKLVHIASHGLHQRVDGIF